jgi:apolipoprotein D and lipocalin family protein
VHRRAAASRPWGRLAALAVPLALSACLGVAPPTDGAFRNQSVPIAATTRFEPDRMAGRWIVRARFAAPDDVEADLPESFVFGQAAGAKTGATFPVRRDRAACNEWECVDLNEDLRAEITALGRFRMPRDGTPADHWVLWTDADFRVVAIGTPSGAFGWIMTRGPARSDLMRAAREILDWNGYDMERLREVKQ